MLGFERLTPRCGPDRRERFTPCCGSRGGEQFIPGCDTGRHERFIVDICYRDYNRYPKYEFRADVWLRYFASVLCGFHAAPAPDYYSGSGSSSDSGESG